MQNETVYVSGMGDAFIPGKYFADFHKYSPIRMFDLYRDDHGKVSRFLKNGGTVVLSGNWKDILSLGEYLKSRECEFLRTARDKRQRNELSARLQQCVLVTLDNTPVKTSAADPGIEAGLVGEKTIPPGVPVLLPVSEAERLSNDLDTLFTVEPAGSSLRTHPDMLTPRSKETISLMCRAIQDCKACLPVNPKILDMGCGSGVLTIVAWRILKDLGPDITATDILPEAVAMTRLNVKHNLDMDIKPGCIANETTFGAVKATEAGDLFSPVPDAKYDLIVFNAPWVKAPARNRAELALNDEGQETIRRFLEECPLHLLPNGRVILGYSDNSGAKTIDRLEKFISDAGLRIAAIMSDRIKTYSSNKPWQKIFAYILVR